ncbi:DUF2057 domain-containing protein [Shewanella loihica]|uniref:DUF2057 domain-containing protein n=1 Tax=Shewanella loihica (strain ATCC BAA-1088 / PV-4) TaxID=323850 RepID=A3QIV6_SHELP|nr:DUF2057 family protein [Shewanella loihica]ABO25404.1 conserved hypothetical protein [Shewanella loihica PV-4]
MKTRHFFSSLFAAFAALTLVNIASAASLTLPDELQVQGSEVQVGHEQIVLSLDAGKQLVELVYRDIFADNADDSGAWVTSEPLYLALDVKGDDAYRLVLPEIVTQQDARAFISAPKARLVSQTGQQQELTLMNHQQLMEKIWLAQ